jgi:hypothetical protein
MENKHLEDSLSSNGWNSFSPSLYVWYVLSRHEVTGTFFFQGKTVNSTNYRDMLEFFTVSPVAHLQTNVFFQQDGAPPHWALTVRESLSKTFRIRSTGLPRYYAIGFFFLWYVKDQVFRSKVGSVVELLARINSAVVSVEPFLHNTRSHRGRRHLQVA